MSLSEHPHDPRPMRSIDADIVASDNRTRDRELGWVFAGLLLALLVRIALFNPDSAGDIHRYTSQAHALLTGQGFGRNGTLETDLPPGYPLLLAAIFAVVPSNNLVRVVQLGLSLGSCLLVYAAIRPRSRRAASLALVALAVCGQLATFSGILLSETWTVFLGSLLVFVLSRLEEMRSAQRQPRIVWMLLAGMLPVALVLTAPGIVFLAVGVWAVVAWHHRCSATSLAWLVAGSLVVMIPWQLHCYRALGRPILTVYSNHPGEQGSAFSSGFGLWIRTWSTHVRDINLWFSNDVEVQIPNEVFSSVKERERLLALLTRYRDPALKSTRLKLGFRDPEMDAAFGTAAARRLEQDPLRFYVIYPLCRMGSLWLHDQRPWNRAFYWTSPLSNLESDRRASSGLASAGANAFVIGCESVYELTGLITVAYPLVFLALAIWACRRPSPLAVVIVVSIAIYTFLSGYLALGEPRRNLTFYPFLFFLLYYAARPRRSRRAGPASDNEPRTSYRSQNLGERASRPANSLVDTNVGIGS